MGSNSLAKGCWRRCRLEPCLVLAQLGHRYAHASGQPHVPALQMAKKTWPKMKMHFGGEKVPGKRKELRDKVDGLQGGCMLWHARYKRMTGLKFWFVNSACAIPVQTCHGDQAVSGPAWSAGWLENDPQIVIAQHVLKPWLRLQLLLLFPRAPLLVASAV